MQVVITIDAQNDLDDIYEYYKTFDKGIIGKRIAAKIITRALSLRQSPYLGKVERFLTDKLNIEHRFLIEKNHKIVYFVDPIENIIFITQVFDTRQNPDKL